MVSLCYRKNPHRHVSVYSPSHMAAPGAKSPVQPGSNYLQTGHQISPMLSTKTYDIKVMWIQEGTCDLCLNLMLSISEDGG